MKTKRIIVCIISCILFMMCIPFTAVAETSTSRIVVGLGDITSGFAGNEYTIPATVFFSNASITGFNINISVPDIFSYSITSSNEKLLNNGTLTINKNNVVYESSDGVTLDKGDILFNVKIFIPFRIEARDYPICITSCKATTHGGYACLTTIDDGTISVVGDTSPKVMQSESCFLYEDKYIASLMYLQDGELDIWVDSVEYETYSSNAQIIGSYAFDPNEIKRYDNLMTLNNCSIRNSFESGNSVYTLSRPAGKCTVRFSIRLYVKNKYNVTCIDFFGNQIQLKPIDEYTDCKEITYNNGNFAIQFKTDIDISGIQNYIDKLEAENASLKQQTEEMNNRINLLSTGVYGDVNGDQVVDIQDAQIILAYYTQKDVALMDVPDLVTFGLNYGKV